MIVKDGNIVRKSDIVREAVARQDYKKALLLAKDFRIGISSEQRKKMALAYECMVHPDFYQSIGRDIEQAKAEGIEEVVKLYGAKL